MGSTAHFTILDGGSLHIGDIIGVARRGQTVVLHRSAREKIEAGHEVVKTTVAQGKVAYGVNTGFGSLNRVRIQPEQIRQVQRNLIRSHAAGIGDVLPEEVVRAVMVVMAASLCRGYSGVRPVVVETLVNVLNAGITPVVPSRGSVGSSGDLAPLSHISLVLIGEGEAWFQGQIMSGGEALEQAGVTPLVLDAKEGLALINGTHLMCAMAALLIADTEHLLASAITAAALSIDACRATDAFLDGRVHMIRQQQGQMRVADRLRTLLDGSTILPSHKTDDPRVQDPYSLRCTPQVLGAAWDMLEYVTTIVNRELSAVTDNPLVFPDNGDIISAGNFHGMPIALALDALKIAVSHIAGISERRVYFLLSASDSENPLNPHLSPQPGLHSGLMIAQYTAAAACNEIQTLAAPASVHNIPTSAGMEDYNSMGATAAHQAWQAVKLATHVIAIELLCSAEALEYQRPLKSGAGVERAHAHIRQQVPRLTEDRPPNPDIEKIVQMIRQGVFD
ncbi:MAG: histidine ammonia-lyase [Chloroflexi bacterium]|nr:histidine ammonia-lyase [Chloroflexota bacterium]